MHRRSRGIVALSGLAGVLLARAQPARRPLGAAEWPMVNRDLASTRYSPLSQINRRNVARLTRA